MPSVSLFVTLPAPTRTSLVIFDTRPDATYELRATLLRPTTSLESDSGQWQCVGSIYVSVSWDLGGHTIERGTTHRASPTSGSLKSVTKG